MLKEIIRLLFIINYLAAALSFSSNEKEDDQEERNVDGMPQAVRRYSSSNVRDLLNIPIIDISSLNLCFFAWSIGHCGAHWPTFSIIEVTEKNKTENINLFILKNSLVRQSNPT